MTQEGTWMSKAELAHVRGISVTSATRLIRRQGWRRQPGNDGRVRVLVPSDWTHPRHDDPRDNPRDQNAGPWDDPRDNNADPRDNPRDNNAGPRDNPRDNNGLLAGALAALEGAVLSLTARAEAAEAVGAAERVRAEDLRQRIAVLNAEMDVARAGLEAEIDRLRAELEAAAKAEFEAVKAARTGGRWRRLRAAWRG